MSLMCWECDALEWQNRYRQRNHGKEPCITVPTEGFGYLRKSGSRDEEWSVAGARIVRAEVSPDRINGPFLHIDDILPQLASLAGGFVRHVCCNCLTSAVPTAADAIATGTICERPGCGMATTSRCRCCRGAFCADHVGPAECADALWRGSWHRSGEVVTIAWGNRGHWSVPGGNVAYCGIRPHGLCEMCTLERASDAEREVIAICDKYPGISRAERPPFGEEANSRHLYEVRTRKMPAGFLQQAEYNRAKTVAGQCGAVIDEKVRALERLPGECRRSQWFARFPLGGPPRDSQEAQEAARMPGKYADLGDYLSSSRLGLFVYVVMDERGKVAPAATFERHRA